MNELPVDPINCSKSVILFIVYCYLGFSVIELYVSNSPMKNIYVYSIIVSNLSLIAIISNLRAE